MCIGGAATPETAWCFPRLLIEIGDHALGFGDELRRDVEMQERAELLPFEIEILDHVPETDAVVARFHSAEDRLEERGLREAIDPRMPRKQCLHERRPRTRTSHNEYALH
ncbi:MAG: hypothetical protein ABI846_02990 [Rudaea sp.]